MDLVFIMADWHASAKLRLHTTSSLATLRELTHLFGIRIRHFVTHICPTYDTRELPKEEAARIRRQTKQRAQQRLSQPATASVGAKKKRYFNLETFKLHSMGDYVNQISWAGTTDSYSTQPVRRFISQIVRTLTGCFVRLG